MKSYYNYSKTIVYDNFSWPQNPLETQVENIEEKAQKALDVRLAFSNSSLADPYNTLTMSPVLVKAHNYLNKAVDQS